MANEISVAQPNMGQLSSVFAGRPVKDKLGEGISTGYGILGYRGKVWSIRYRGEETKILDGNGDPVASIEAIIVDAADHTSKIFYEGGWVEGNTAPPDCFSNDGVVPDVSAPKKQNPVCATCPKNAWNSAPNGGKGKACGDFKRTAVIPLNDPRNDLYGGPMLLRIPAASLQDAAQYSATMSKIGYATYTIGTRIGFDMNESYPKFTFRAIRALTDDEAKIVVEFQNDDIVKRILGDSEIAQAPQQVTPDAVAQAFEQPPVQVQPKPVQPVQQVQPQPAQQTAQVTPVVTNPPAKPNGFGGAVANPQPAQPVAAQQVPPATAQSPSPSVTQPQQAANTQPPAGGAPTVSPTETAIQATPVTPDENASAGDDFEAALEARLSALMPAAKG